MNTEWMAAWLLTLGIHVGLFLLVAWVIERAVPKAQLGWREWLWRVALFGGILSSTAQMLFDAAAPTRITLVTPAAVANPAPTAPRGFDASAPREPKRNFGTPIPGAMNKTRPADAGDAWTSPQSGEAFAWPSWHRLLIAAWLAGSLLGLGRLAGAWLRLRSVVARAQTLRDPTLQSDADQLAAMAGISSPRLGVLPELPSPIALTAGRIVLPTWVLEQFSRAQNRALLAHEIAHLARRDPHRRLLVAVGCALLWFMPLAFLARRRLDAIAELSCDAWAAARIGDRRAMAECLAGCAERRRFGMDLALASPMASRHSPLLQRIDQLMDGSPMKMTVFAPAALFATSLVLIAAVGVLPGIAVRQAEAATDKPRAPTAPAAPVAPAAPTAPDSSRGEHLHISSETDDNGRTHQSVSMQTDNGERRYLARIEGQVTYTPGYDGIASLGAGSTASFSETRDGVARRIEYANRGGQLQRRYFVDDQESPIDTGVETWIAGVIPELIRETGIDARKRVREIHAQGGTRAVLDEIGRIHSDYARAEYIEQLTAFVRLAPAEVTRALGLIDAFQSDYERRRALTALAKSGRYDADQQRLVIAQAGKIDSDYERAELLISLLPNLDASASLRRAWLDAANGIESDYEHRRCLEGLVEAGGNDDALLGSVIDAAKGIESDYERRELLSSAIARIGNAEGVADAYAQAVIGMGGDYERGEALRALLHAPGFGTKAAHAVLDALEHVDSDHECSEVLVVLARSMPGDAGLIEQYRQRARRLSSYEREQAERALERVVL